MHAAWTMYAQGTRTAHTASLPSGTICGAYMIELLDRSTATLVCRGVVIATNLDGAFLYILSYFQQAGGPRTCMRRYD